MKIIYDISVLGMGHVDSRARSGIFRVVENVLLGLAASPECEVSLCATRVPLYALRYLDAEPRLADLPLVQGRLDAHREIHAMTKAGKDRALADRVISGLVQKAYWRVHPFFSPLQPGVLDRHDIYHSPFHSIPKQVRRAKRVKKFLTVYDLIPVKFPHLFTKDILTTFRRALADIGPDTWVLCISEATKADLLDHVDISPERVFVTPLAADPTIFHRRADRDDLARVRRRYGIPPGPYLLSVGTLEPRKNLDHLIRCFARVVERERIDDLRLVLVGAKGWKYDAIFDALENAECIRERVVFAGFVDDADCAALYGGALAFAYPSLYEGFGLPPLEAMQCGAPVLTSNTSSLPEVVGGAGITLDPTDEAAWCRAILEVYRDGAVREKLAARSIEQAKRFSWRRCVEQTIAAYRTALET